MTALRVGRADPADIRRGDDLRELVRADVPLMRALTVVRDSGLPDAWIGAGVLRDLVWGRRYGTGFDLRAVRDVDVAFFDPADLSRDNDDRATARLATAGPGLPWEAKNQAAVHTWYPRRFGGPSVPPFRGIAEAVATWPEYATPSRSASTPTTTSRSVRHTASMISSTAYGDATPPASANRPPTSGFPGTSRRSGGQ